MDKNEEYLKAHLEGLENGGSNSFVNEQEKKVVEGTKTSDLKYHAFDTKMLPCGIFYPPGSSIQVRPATVKEIQAYSMVDDENFYDIVEKMNSMLSSCVRVKYADGTVAPYLHIKDPDRFFVIFLIRELTFQKGNTLSTNVKCSCGTENKMELILKNFQKFETPSKINKYFDATSSTFVFRLKNGITYRLSPPNIGLQKSFTDYIVKMSQEKKNVNLSFLKIMPFMLGNTKVTMEDIEKTLKEFEQIDEMSFQFLNDAIDMMKYGIEKLKTNCTSCGLEVHTDMVFPNGASGIFVIRNAFDQFIED